MLILLNTRGSFKQEGTRPFKKPVVVFNQPQRTKIVSSVVDYVCVLSRYPLYIGILTVRTGHGAYLTTCDAVLPKRTLSIPFRP